MTVKTERIWTIPTSSERLKQRASVFNKFLLRFLSIRSLAKFIVLFYKGGVFFFKLYDALSSDLKLIADKRQSLLKDSDGLDSFKGSLDGTDSFGNCTHNTSPNDGGKDQISE